MPPSRSLLYSHQSVLQIHPSRARRHFSHRSNVRYVKVIKRPWSRRGFIANILLCGLAAYFWSSFVPARKDNTSSNTASQQTVEGHSAPETTSRNRMEAVFIPTGWTHQEEGRLYAATDPEWREFVKISKSPEKLQSLKVSERACLSDSYMDFKTLDKLGGASQSESPSTHLQPSSILATLRWLPLPKLGPGSDLYDAAQVFKKRINECQRSDSRAYRQGIFFIRGPVGLKGSQGSCRIQVEGEYDPVTSEWVSVSMHLNDLAFLSQKPLGRK
ncbi:hypothetical protein BDW60DRAFT_215538 [Aspergillus nidulans var. acristatus]